MKRIKSIQEENVQELEKSFFKTFSINAVKEAFLTEIHSTDYAHGEHNAYIAYQRISRFLSSFSSSLEII